MSPVKDALTKLVQDQPDDSTYDEILRELAFNLIIQRGLRDSDEEKAISDEEMEHRIRSWQKQYGRRNPPIGIGTSMITSRRIIRVQR